MSKITIGQKVICPESGVVGGVVKFYTPTSCEEQTMIKAGDGRQYHAPTRTWVPYRDGMDTSIIIFDETHITSQLKTGRLTNVVIRDRRFL